MKWFVIYGCLIMTVTSATRKLPSFIEVCRPKHVDVSECIRKNIEILRPKFTNGIPELGISSFNPLKIPSAEAKLGENFKVELKNIQIAVSKSFILEDLKVDLDNFRLQLKIKFPEVRTSADYRVNGSVLLLTLDGTGVGKLNLYNLEAKLVALGKKENIQGKYYIVPTSIDIKPELESMDIHLENLFPRNPELTEQANKIFNENQRVLFEDFSPMIVNIIKRMITNYIQKFFERYSFDVLFPDD